MNTHISPWPASLIGWSFEAEFPNIKAPAPLGEYGETLMERLLDIETATAKQVCDPSVGITDPDEGDTQIDIFLAVREPDLGKAYEEFSAALRAIGEPDGIAFHKRLFPGFRVQPWLDYGTGTHWVNSEGDIAMFIPETLTDRTKP